MNLIVAALLTCAQLQQPAPPKVDQRKVDEAVRKGVEFLKGSKERKGPELVLWTLVHAGVPETDEKFQTLLKEMLDEEPKGTYRTALRAMILEELDRVKYQEEIWKCAQYLVDNQSPKGYWGYGQPTTYSTLPKPVPTGKKDAVATSGRKPTSRGAADLGPGGLIPPGVRVKPAVKQLLEVKKQRDGKDNDNSNSQYAALGLRACHDAGILLPKEVLELAEKWWRTNQEGGRKAGSGEVATPGGVAAPRGWHYQRGEGYGSMTAGGLGSLVITLHLQSKPWMRDPDVLSGLAWMAENFSVSENPGGQRPFWHYYFLYGMERAGVLYGTEWMGKHPWYSEGANFLIGAQKPDGSWSNDAPQSHSTPTWDTCFAILFLRRATRPLIDVASVDPYSKKK